MAEQAPMLLLSNVRIVFPKLLEGQAEKFKPTDKDAYYSASFLIKPDDPQIELIKADIRRAAVAKFRDQAEAQLLVFQAKDKLPIHDGAIKSGKPYGDAYKGMLYVSARNAEKGGPVPVYDNVADPKTNEARIITSISDPKFPYSGCYVNVYLNLFGYNQGGGEGVGASIAGVQFNADGERLAGGQTAKAGAFKAAPPPAATLEKAVASGQGAKSLFG